MLFGKVLLDPCIASAGDASRQSCECSSASLGAHSLARLLPPLQCQLVHSFRDFILSLLPPE